MIYKTQMDALIKNMLRVMFTVFGFVCSYFIYYATDSFIQVRNDQEIIKQQLSGFQQKIIDNDKQTDRIENVVNSHAVDIQVIKIDMREIQTTLRMR